MPEIMGADWVALERGFGRIDPHCRHEILHLLHTYVLNATFEKAAAKLEDARKALAKIRGRAVLLKTALTATSQAESDGTSYAQHKILNHVRHDLLDAWRTSEVGKPLQKDPVTLLVELMDATVVAADCGAQELRLEAEVESYDDPWRQFVLQLTLVLEGQKLPTAARKDSDKTVDKPSPFVVFLLQLQSHLPPDLRRHQGSFTSLAKAVAQARRTTESGR